MTDIYSCPSLGVLVEVGSDALWSRSLVVVVLPVDVLLRLDFDGLVAPLRVIPGCRLLNYVDTQTVSVDYVYRYTPLVRLPPLRRYGQINLLLDVFVEVVSLTKFDVYNVLFLP